MAPERFRGKSDRRGDIYSLGATLYELLALRPPFEESDQIRLIERIRNDPPVPPRQLDRQHSARPGDDRPEGAGQGPEGPVRLGGRAGRRAAAVRRGPADPVAAGVGRRAVLAVVQARPVAGRREHRRGAADDRPGRRLDGGRRRLPQPGQSALRIERGRSDSGGARRPVARGRRLHRPSPRRAVQPPARPAIRKPRGRGPGHEVARRPPARASRPTSRRETLRDLAIACMALPDLKPTGRVIHSADGCRSRPPSIPTMTRYALRFPRRDDLGPPRRRRPGDRRVQGPGDRDLWIFGFSPDGRYLATTQSPDVGLTVWDVEHAAPSLSRPGPTSGHGGPIQPGQPPDRRGAVMAKFLIYDLATGQLVRRWPGTHGRLAFRPDGAQIAVH